MGEYLSRGGYIGKNVGDVIQQHQNFSQATWFCRRLQEGIDCLTTEPKLKSNESCPTVFQIGHCWRETLHGEMLNTTCPGLNPLRAPSNQMTSRFCFPNEVKNGTKYPAEWMSIKQVYYEYIKQDCEEDYPDTVYPEVDPKNYPTDYDDYFNDYPIEYPDYPNLSLPDPSTVGVEQNLHEHIILSILSFITTLVSLLLMIFFLRKCTRIYIHMNLLCAFMLRSLIFLWGQLILGIWHTPKYHYINNLIAELDQYMNNLFKVEDLPQMDSHYSEYCITQLENERRFLFLCRLYPCIQHYIVLVCFAWLSCEGMYLILLQQRPSVIACRINPLKWFVGLSWILPGFIVAIWAVAMLNREDGQFNCFDSDKYILWIVEGPIQLFIFICFIIFIVLLKDIIHKLRAPDYITGRGNFSWRMSKATLSLIPLLGIQYMVMPYLSEEYGVPAHMVPIITSITISITASHGIVVSFLYCFTSSEMKEALIRRWRLHREIQGVYNEIASRRESRDSNSGLHTIQQLINRIAGRRSSVLSRRNDSLEHQNCDSRNDQMLIEPINYIQTGVPVSTAKRHSACSKHSDDSLESNGYHSGKSDHDDHILDHDGSLPISEQEHHTLTQSTLDV